MQAWNDKAHRKRHAQSLTVSRTGDPSRIKDKLRQRWSWDKVQLLGKGAARIEPYFILWVKFDLPPGTHQVNP
jgi:hypothetical protein